MNCHAERSEGSHYDELFPLLKNGHLTTSPRLPEGKSGQAIGAETPITFPLMER